MMIYRGMFPDWFDNVEANSEEEAVQKIKEKLVKNIEAEGEELIIVWEERE